MTFNVHQSSIRPIRKGDKGFMLSDGLVASPRAGFEFNNDIPNQYKTMILQCIECGWLKPVAYVKDAELFWEEFSK